MQVNPKPPREPGPILAPPDDQILRGWKGAKKKTGKSIPQLKRDVKAGRFPAPFELGANSLAWWESWIDAWLADRPRRTYRGPLATKPDRPLPKPCRAQTG